MKTTIHTIASITKALRADTMPGWHYNGVFLAKHDPGTGNLGHHHKCGLRTAAALVLDSLSISDAYAIEPES